MSATANTTMGSYQPLSPTTVSIKTLSYRQKHPLRVFTIGIDTYFSIDDVAEITERDSAELKALSRANCRLNTANGVTFIRSTSLQPILTSTPDDVALMREISRLHKKNCQEHIMSGDPTPALSTPVPYVNSTRLQTLLGNHSTQFDWLKTLTAPKWVVENEGNGVKKIGLHEYAISLPIALGLCLHATTFAGSVAVISIIDSIQGSHTQASLDKSLAHCEGLLPDAARRINVRILHQHLGSMQPFSLWFCKRVKDLKMIEGVHYHRTLREVTKGKNPGILPVYRWEISVIPEFVTKISMVETSLTGRLVNYHLLHSEKMRVLDLEMDQGNCLKAYTHHITDLAEKRAPLILD